MVETKQGGSKLNFFKTDKPQLNQIENIMKHLNLLGLRVKDKVTGLEGIVASIGFDLFGCVQAIINPGLDKDGKLQDQHWFDVNRLQILDKTPVMDRPDFITGRQAEGKQGASEKPKYYKS